MSNYIMKTWYESITHLCPQLQWQFTWLTVEVRAWMRNHIPQKPWMWFIIHAQISVTLFQKALTPIDPRPWSWLSDAHMQHWELGHTGYMDMSYIRCKANTEAYSQLAFTNPEQIQVPRRKLRQSGHGLIFKNPVYLLNIRPRSEKEI